MLDDRYQRWIAAAAAAGAFDKLMVPLVQGLLADRCTLSYFWVLAAYELVRTLDQRWRIGATSMPDEFASRIAALKRRMDRLRIPLLKMETPRRFPTDSTMAYPTISRDFGVAWNVAEDVHITRRELSDQLLSFLADLKERKTPTKA